MINAHVLWLIETFWFFASNVGRKIGQSELKKKAIAQQHWEQSREEPEQSDPG